MNHSIRDAGISVGAKSNKPRVLVIEDDLNMRIYLCNLLRGGGFDPVDAHDRKIGLKKARSSPPDLIVLDGMMPDETSPEIYYQLKSDPELHHIPVIMLATIDQRTFCYYHRCRSLQHPTRVPDPEAYMTKPPEAEEFLEVVRRLAELSAITNSRGSP